MTHERSPESDAHVGVSTQSVNSDEVVGDDEGSVPANAWVTMGLFAVFVIAFGTCASTFMFN